MRPTRRHLISAASASLLLAGCRDSVGVPMDSEDTGGDTGDTGESLCPSLVEGGTLEALLPFEDGSLPLEERLESGLDGRYAIDLEALPDEPSPILENGRHFIRTFAPQNLDAWDGLRVDGVVTSLPESVDIGAVLMECSGNGSNRSFGLISAATWAGVPVLDVLDADHIEVVGLDDHGGSTSSSTQGCSWVFTREQLQDAILATHMNGAPLPVDHGAPVRLIVPGWFGCTCVKWVSALNTANAGTPASSQMKEFASRTHQTAAHALARDYAPARIQAAAMPIRVERWTLDGETVYLIYGIVWGGLEPARDLEIRLDQGWEPVTFCPEPETAQTWTVWRHLWRPEQTGAVDIVLRIAEDVPQIRLDQGYYSRRVMVL